jgi:hypothetical protein
MSEEVVSIFLSYSRKDGDMLSRLNTHLAGLIRTQKIKTWHDRDIEAGSEWEPAIQHQLNTADIVILLISADFIASEYCYGNELRRAIERHNAGEVIVIPIILKPCLWNLRDIPFSKLNVLPDHARPVTRWEDPEEALANVANHIAKMVERLNTQKEEQRQAKAAEVQAQWERQILDQAKAALAEEQRDQENEKTLQVWESAEAEKVAETERQRRLKLHLKKQKEEILQKSTESTDELAVKRSLNYAQLEESLKTQQWRKADYKTYLLMLTTVGKVQGEHLDLTVLESFPCEDLRTIDQLWMQYSNGKWGFSVQNQIWEDCGGPLDTSDKKWMRFGDRVGWRKDGKWINYDELSFDLQRSSRGEFPIFGCSQSQLVGRRPGRPILGLGNTGFPFLAQRLVGCGLLPSSNLVTPL